MNISNVAQYFLRLAFATHSPLLSPLSQIMKECNFAEFHHVFCIPLTSPPSAISYSCYVYHSPLWGESKISKSRETLRGTCIGGGLLFRSKILSDFVLLPQQLKPPTHNFSTRSKRSSLAICSSLIEPVVRSLVANKRKSSCKVCKRFFSGYCVPRQ